MGEDTRFGLSLAPIDVGFDVRLHGICVKLGNEALRVKYTSKHGPDGILSYVEGDVMFVASQLRLAGYEVEE